MRALIFVSTIFAGAFAAESAMAVCPTPADVTNFMPPLYVPPNQQQVCSQQQISDYYTNCLDAVQATQMKCSMFTMNNTSCTKCLSSMRTDPKWGATVIGNGLVTINVAGCADIEGFKSCAQAWEATQACESAACDMVCPVMDNQSFMQWQQCVGTAVAGGCKKYADAQTMACSSDAAALQMCTSFMGFQQAYNQIAPIFCLSQSMPDAGTSDGGPDMDSSVIDSGAKDSGAKYDSGNPGVDAGSIDDFVKPGCHCDTSGGNGEQGLAAMLGFALVAALRPRNKKRH